MKHGLYVFKRSRGRSGLLRTNRPSTDAINALNCWKKHHDRDYKKIVDQDDLLVAEITFEGNDKNAGSDLDIACDNNGVEAAFKASL